MLFPLGSVAEQLERVDVAYNVVDVIAVNDNLGVAALDEFLLEFLNAAVYAYGIDFGTWHHAVAHPDV